MSMLSSKCDGLRNAADELQNVIDNAHNYTWTGIVSTLHYAQQGIRDAANTIWGLSCKLADTVDQSEEVKRIEDENARLRSCLSDDAENARQIMAENAKLREFAKLYLDAAGVDCGICPYRDPDFCDTETDPMREGCRLWDEMRKLGIEVK